MDIPKRITPNRSAGRQGHKPEIIVLHYDTGEPDGTGTINTIMRQGNGSYHFTVGTVTKITQHVEITDMAWANGTSPDRNHRLWNGHASHPVVRLRAANANLYTVAVCVPGNRAPVNEARIQSTVELLAYIREQVYRIYGHWIPVDRAHIIGHNEIARTECPGNFPFDDVIRRLREFAGLPTQAREAPAVSTAPPADAFAAGDAYRLYIALPGHSTADDARTGKNRRNTMPPGDYFVFRTHGTQLNITGTPGSAGSWINGLLNVPPEDARPTPEAPPRNMVTIVFPSTTKQVETLGVVNGRHLIRLKEGPDGQPQDDVVLRQVLNTFGFTNGEIKFISTTNTIDLT
jgi:N-acetyl-anhydromuramyl-L-alanine amidase AmpD